jgi:hypothetical protein
LVAGTSAADETGATQLVATAVASKAARNVRFIVKLLLSDERHYSYRHLVDKD